MNTKEQSLCVVLEIIWRLLMNKYLTPYVSLVEYLGKFLGEDYEVVLHEVGKYNQVVAIANSSISGRTIGSPLTNKAKLLIQNKEYEKNDYVTNYVGLSSKGHTLRSSTYFVKDPSGNLIGLLCINFDDNKYRKFQADLLNLCHPIGFGTDVTANEADSISHRDLIERFPVTAENARDEAIQNAIDDAGIEIGRMTQEEKLSIIEKLQHAGIFEIKGAVESVSRSLSCSQASVYRYLSMLKKPKS